MLRVMVLSTALLGLHVLIGGAVIGAVRAEVAVAALPDSAVARVSEELVSRDWHRHWQRIARRSVPEAGEREARRMAMAFVLSAEWTEQEAEERGIRVSSRRVRERFRRQRREAFDSRAEYRRYLRETGQTTTDVRYRVRVDLYAIAIKRQLQRREPLRTRAEQQARFGRVLKREYRPVTVCAKGYRVRLCRNY